MRANRVLVAKGWYWVFTDVNNREGVFRLPRVVQMLRTVLCEAHGVYEFEVRGLRVEDDRVSFISMPRMGLRLYSSIGDSSRKNRSNFEKFEKKYTFFAVFSRWAKAYPLAIALYTVRGKFSQKNIARRFAYESKSCIGAERLVLGFNGCQ